MGIPYNLVVGDGSYLLQNLQRSKSNLSPILHSHSKVKIISHSLVISIESGQWKGSSQGATINVIIRLT